jgi:hypothetical protein
MPNLTFNGDVRSATTAAVTFVVYADGTSQSVGTHSLVLGPEPIATDEANVCLLIDRVDDDTWLVDIPAVKPKVLSSRWKPQEHDLK